MSSDNHTNETKHSLDNVKSEEIYNFAFEKKVTEKNSSINYCIISKNDKKILCLMCDLLIRLITVFFIRILSKLEIKEKNLFEIRYF